ncbi:ammonium transporter [Deferribacter autotrophicus]|uniref:Ammonium transporter n=1 Tax=Deferribacter autotrophicus TaxID=500465 RepID=A0A5A8F3D2_9BACT|nr:ammonium transporter [Deferribacter autotrophicus]KAA0257837.1 ammonium transporter [Deferribacter autotrophicus]
MKRIFFSIIFILSYSILFGADDAIDAKQVQTNLDWLWTLIAAFLVFFMQLGFAMVETGFTRAKNAVNIIMKNLMDFSMGVLGFFAVGFALMFGKSYGGLIGTEGFFLLNWGPGDNWTLAFFLFQAMFCATAATIVSGAIAERANFKAYLIFSFLMSAIVYPIFGSWAWGSLFHGNGWLEKLGFIDFAGSTVVHSIGGWAALAGAIVLGPRVGKYSADGKIRAIPGHNIPLATIGVFILWFGWYGFNVGSETAADAALPLIALNTTLAPAASSITALVVTYNRYKKFDAGMALNGVLSGLVGITAGCANVTPFAAILIGVVSGVVVVYSVLFFEKIKVDDPVGAISVHGVCGAWGTIAAGLFNYNFEQRAWEPVFLSQIIGVVVAFIWGFVISFILFKVIDKINKFRVSEEEEFLGLDLYEHGIKAYPEFPISHIK